MLCPGAFGLHGTLDNIPGSFNLSLGLLGDLRRRFDPEGQVESNESSHGLGLIENQKVILRRVSFFEVWGGHIWGSYLVDVFFKVGWSVAKTEEMPSLLTPSGAQTCLVSVFSVLKGSLKASQQVP